MTRASRFLSIVALCAALAPAAAATPRDAIILSSASANTADAVSLDVFLRDTTGTPLGTDAASGNRIQALAFRLFFPAADVTSVSFERAGLLQNLTPIYERSASGPGVFGYLATFSEATSPIPFTANAAGGDRIGTLHVQLSSSSGGAITFMMSCHSA